MTLAALVILLALHADPASAAPVTGNPMVRSVTDYGVVSDGTTDCTAAFQRALDAAAAANGGIVEAPSGRYRFDSAITVPPNVTLRGTFTYSPSHTGMRDAGAPKPVYGSVLEPRCGAGSEEGAPFITLQDNATLQGFSVHYPEQKPDAAEPTPYPYAVAMRGNNPAIVDVELLNPFNGIDACKNQRALIRNIHGQPIHIGLYVNEIYDIGRIENVHWNPWWTMGTPVYDWQFEHGTGFVFGRTDWHYVINTFCFGYDVGYKFIKTKEGTCNGNFLGIGADDCRTSMLVEDTAPMGVLITNGEFVSFHGPDPTMIRVKKTHTGTIRFVNCAFWGPARRNAVVDGVGTVGFSDCSFMQWGHAPKGFEKADDKSQPSIDALGGSVIVRGCEFMENRKQLRIGAEVERAIVSENLVTGRVRVDDQSRGGTVIIRDNAGTPTGKRWKKIMDHRPGYRASQLDGQ